MAWNNKKLGFTEVVSLYLHGIPFISLKKTSFLGIFFWVAKKVNSTPDPWGTLHLTTNLIEDAVFTLETWQVEMELLGPPTENQHEKIEGIFR